MRLYRPLLLVYSHLGACNKTGDLSRCRLAILGLYPAADVYQVSAPPIYCLEHIPFDYGFLFVSVCNIAFT